MANKVFADISNNNDRFDASAYHAAGHVIVAIKASEGVFFADPNHRKWALHAGGKGIHVIHYHFGRPDRSSGRDEADFFLHCCGGLLGPHDYVVYDGERARNGAFGLDAEHCRAFDTRVQERTRYHTILYASASQSGASAEHALVGKNKRNWDADYSHDADVHIPGGVCVMRQFTDGIVGPEPHVVAGVGRCDVNVLRGEFARQVLASAR